MLRYIPLALLVVLGNTIPAQSAPELQVHVGTTIVPGSTGVIGLGAVEFGTAPVGKAAAKTFTVKNVGTSTVTLLEPIAVPKGFTLQRSFASRVLAAGQSTTFIAALNAARTGAHLGQISFSTTSDGRRGLTQFPVAGLALPKPSLRIVNDSDADFRTIGQWRTMTGLGFQGQVHYVPPGNGSNVASWTFTGLKPGHYRVAATWPELANRASNASFTIHKSPSDSKAFTAVVVDQQQAPNDFRDAGVGWKNLGGVYRVADTLVVRLSDRANANVVADAIRLERVGFRGQIIDDAQPGFSTQGHWNPMTRGFNNRALMSATDLSRAHWTFQGLRPGLYRISATWPSDPQAATNASFALLDGTRQLARPVVNQRLVPRDFSDAGAMWQDLGDLGGFYLLNSGILQVHLAAGRANGPVIADAIRVELIDDPSVNPFITGPDAVRFLEQSTWGPNPNEINNVIASGPGPYITAQMNATPSLYPDYPLVNNSQTTQCHGDATCNRINYSPYLVQNQFFFNALYGPDQLRQRVAWALHKILVVSASGQLNRPSHLDRYLNIFANNAFGSYQTILHNITLNPAMGQYLNLRTSTKTLPNENYAREVMQLFSIGLDLLNNDGTLQTDANGDPIPTYDQTTVVNFAKALTSWHLAAQPQPGYDNYKDPMVSTASLHDTTAKTLLNGVVLPANQTATQDLNGAIQNIFAHQNVGPFISKNLIQQLVTSNPSPDYVARITATFNDNGSGVKGDLSALIPAILLDPEARGDFVTDPNYGHLREPALYVNNICRAFTATSYDQTTTSDGYLNPQTNLMEQNCFVPPSVFSYFSPLYVLDATATPPLLGPEYQIQSTSTSLKRVNFLNTMVNPNGSATTCGIAANGTTAPNGTKLYLDPYLDQAANDPNGLVETLNQLLLHGTMSDNMRASVSSAVQAVGDSNPLRRVKVAVYLIASSSQYQVQQ
jgi:uncharacterized protein (DUF1800 family)